MYFLSFFLAENHPANDAQSSISQALCKLELEIEI